MDVDALESTVRQARPALSVLIPDFHNPVGCLMPDDEHARVARSGTFGHVRSRRRDTDRLWGGWDVPAPLPMAAHDTRIITGGSASKSFWEAYGSVGIRAASDRCSR